MTPTEKPRFMELLSTLFGAHGKPLSDSMVQGYWKGLEKMSLVEFERCCDSAIDRLQYAERGVSKTPTVAELWDIKRGFRARVPVKAEKEPEFVGDEWDIAANQLLLAYIAQNSLKRDPVNYAPDSHGYPVKTGEHTKAIAEILHRYAKQWAQARRADARDHVKSDGKIEWLAYMSAADREVTNYLAQMQRAA